METALDEKLQQELEVAKQVISGLALPPEIENLSVDVGFDASGEPALWLHLHVKSTVKSEAAEVKTLTQFARDVQSLLFRAGISLFPYTSLEQAA